MCHLTLTVSQCSMERRTDVDLLSLHPNRFYSRVALSEDSMWLSTSLSKHLITVGVRATSNVAFGSGQAQWCGCDLSLPQCTDPFKDSPRWQWEVKILQKLIAAQDEYCNISCANTKCCVVIGCLCCCAAPFQSRWLSFTVAIDSIYSLYMMGSPPWNDCEASACSLPLHLWWLSSGWTWQREGRHPWSSWIVWEDSHVLNSDTVI